MLWRSFWHTGRTSTERISHFPVLSNTSCHFRQDLRSSNLLSAKRPSKSAYQHIPHASLVVNDAVPHDNSPPSSGVHRRPAISHSPMTGWLAISDTLTRTNRLADTVSGRNIACRGEMQSTPVLVYLRIYNPSFSAVLALGPNGVD